jgi:membrane protease YdiL (CAAX protease family)
MSDSHRPIDGPTPIPGHPRDRSGRFTAIAVGLELGALALALAVGWLTGTSVWALLRPSLLGTLLAIPATLPLLAVMWLVSRSTWPPFRRLLTEVDEHVLPLFAHCSVGALALIAAAAGVGEEALFRGALLAAIAGPLGMPVALAATSIVFGLVHFVTPTYAVLAGLVGAYLGWLAVATGGVWAPAVAHGLYDFVALVLLLRAPRRRPTQRGG